MEKLSLTSSSSAKLTGLAEGDEFYIKSGLKGRQYHLKIVKPGRKPRKRGPKQWNRRGTFYTDHQMIT